MEIVNKNILVLGLGKSGEEVLKFLTKYNTNIFLYDDNEKLLNEYTYKFGCSKYVAGIKIDMAIISPGISKFHYIVGELKKLNVKIISELEFAYTYSKGKIIAVTGTNGKTTTVTLIGEILKNYTRNCFILGNIGIPYITMVDNMSNESITCLEVSSFQLEFIEKFHPNISIILNLQPDHLDRYYNELDYYNTKLSICNNYDIQDYVILNFDDENVKCLENVIKANKLYVSLYEKVHGIYYNDGYIYFNLSEFNYRISTSNFKLLGKHNLYNIMTSILSTYLIGVPITIIIDTINNFHGLPHRMQFIKKISGVNFINDSKATNIAASLTAINSIDGYQHVLIGGSDKGEDFTRLFKNINSIKHVSFYFFGANKEELYNTAKLCGVNKKIYVVQNLSSAVELAYNLASNGDTILLSPACASFDYYKNYAERGNHFIEIVRSLNDKK